MDVGEVRTVEACGSGELFLVETGMFGVTGYGGVYLLAGDRPAIVETGIGANYECILLALEEVGIHPSTVETIALTHVHLDHAGGAGYLAEACPNATVVVQERGAPHLADPARLVEGTKRAVGRQWEFYADPVAIPEARIRAVTHGETVDLGSHHLEVLGTPGHAPHQIAYGVPELDAIFTGDAAGIWIPDRETVRETTPPPNFRLEQAIDDLERLIEWNPSTLLYTHFGPAPYSEPLLEAYAETLRRWIDSVATRRSQLEDDEAVINAFIEATDLGSVWSPRKAREEVRLNVTGALQYLDEAGSADPTE